jgi:hypothetical protein
MAVSPNKIVTPQTPRVATATLTSPTAITSRANITGTTGLTVLTPTTTNGVKIYELDIKAKETTVAGSVCVWIYNATTSFLYDEILVSAVTASTTVDSWRAKKTYDNLVLGPTDQLYVSVTVDQDFTVFAHGADL